MTIKLDSFDEFIEWYSKQNKYGLIAFKFENASYNSPNLSNIGSLYNTVLEARNIGQDAFIKGYSLEILM
jgi:hypothetical protein